MKKGFFGTFPTILAFIFGFIAMLVFIYHFRYRLSLTIVETTKWRSNFHYLTQALTLSYEDVWKEEFYEKIPQNCMKDCEKSDDVYICSCKYKLPINFAISKLYWLNLYEDLWNIFIGKLPGNALLLFRNKDNYYFFIFHPDIYSILASLLEEIEEKTGTPLSPEEINPNELLSFTFFLYKQKIPILEGEAELQFFILR